MTRSRQDLAQPGRSPRCPRGLSVGAKAAWAESRRFLGDDDFRRFETAVLRYVRAVDVSDRVFAEWVGLGRPLVFLQPNRALGQHPLVVAWLAASKTASVFGAELGLSPLAASRLGPRRGQGRPMGANSAPDRVAEPPVLTRPGLTLAPPGA